MAQPVQVTTTQMLTKIAMLQMECDARAAREDELNAEVFQLREELREQQAAEVKS
jgi:hypothetical protein